MEDPTNHSVKHKLSFKIYIYILLLVPKLWDPQQSQHQQGSHLYRVGEGVLGHIHQGLVLRRDPVDWPRLGELELELGLGRDEEQAEVNLLLTSLLRLPLKISA